MALEIDLYDCLKTINGGLSALRAPQNAPHPYSVYNVVSDIKTTCASGMTDFPQIRFQIDVYSDDLVELLAIKDDVILKLNACDKFKTVIYQNFQNVVDAGKTLHSVIDFKLTY